MGSRHQTSASSGRTLIAIDHKLKPSSTLEPWLHRDTSAIVGGDEHGWVVALDGGHACAAVNGSLKRRTSVRTLMAAGLRAVASNDGGALVVGPRRGTDRPRRSPHHARRSRPAGTPTSLLAARDEPFRLRRIGASAVIEQGVAVAG